MPKRKDAEAMMAQTFGQLSIKKQHAVEWIEKNNDGDMIMIGQCKCHRAGDKKAYAWIQHLPDKIVVGCQVKNHNWEDIILVEELQNINDNPKRSTAKYNLKDTIQWWKIHDITENLKPNPGPRSSPALETQVVRIPESEIPENTSGVSQFAVTCGSGAERDLSAATRVNIATIVQFAAIAYRVNWLGHKFFQHKIRRAWEEKNPSPLIQAIIPFIDLVPGFSWITDWLRQYTTDPIVTALLVEVLKRTFAGDEAVTDTISSSSGRIETTTPNAHSGATAAATALAAPAAFPHVGPAATVADDGYQAARIAFNKRMFDSRNQGGKQC